MNAGVKFEGDPNKFNMFYCACQNNNPEFVQLIMLAGVDVNDTIVGGCAPLYSAAQKGNAEVCNILLLNGANVDKDFNGFTPLYTACQSGHYSTVEYLLKAGACVNLDTNGFTTALYAATEKRDLRLVQLVLSHGASVNRGNTGATFCSPLYMVKMLYWRNCFL